MPFGILAIGPAGVGKTTMCHALQIHGRMHKRGIYVVNLDPAAEFLPYEPDVDVRELITADDVMHEMGFGPNGGLVYCMEYLGQHLEWLGDKIAEFGADDTLIFDCPGQLELYTHVPVMPRIVAALESWGVHMCSCFLVDAVSLGEPSKFVAGSLAGLSAMLTLPVPNITVLSKSDLVNEDDLEEFLEVGSAAVFLNRCEADRDALFADEAHARVRQPYRKLTAAICSVLDDHSMLSYLPFSVKDEESAGTLLSFADHVTQYAENAEVNIPNDPDEPDED
ncbi:GPN-loop GTPase [Pelagophyceae sp. CCMP2097]|nr:GPN-loop GTPase [Pelagophyceae sp. CCMP2097]